MKHPLTIPLVRLPIFTLTQSPRIKVTPLLVPLLLSLTVRIKCLSNFVLLRWSVLTQSYAPPPPATLFFTSPLKTVGLLNALRQLLATRNVSLSTHLQLHNVRVLRPEVLFKIVFNPVEYVRSILAPKFTTTLQLLTAMIGAPLQPTLHRRFLYIPVVALENSLRIRGSPLVLVP